MADQFINEQEDKVEEITDTSASKQKELDRIAEKAAQKAANTEKQAEKDHPIFSE